MHYQQNMVNTMVNWLSIFFFCIATKAWAIETCEYTFKILRQISFHNNVFIICNT